MRDIDDVLDDYAERLRVSKTRLATIRELELQELERRDSIVCEAHLIGHMPKRKIAKLIDVTPARIFHILGSDPS